MIIGIALEVVYQSWRDQATLSVTNPNGPIRRGNTGQRVVALTCNVDWGEEYLPALLEILASQQVKVTFFISGRWAERNPELTKQIAAGGHEIGNHGYSHPHPNNLSREQLIREIQRTHDTLTRITGQPVKLFAPPYGECSPKVVNTTASLGYRVVLWSLDTIDWQKPVPSVIVQRVVPRIHNDAIILMHPTFPTVKALPQIIDQLRKQGYEFKTVSEISSFLS
ncbi:MAG: polysaccharide deacetylase family protein [Firmicutes bacterium]|nr:polysaccharide deacetylase family protein [Bacillota bacterium]